MSFARALRSILRQDPDVIMVGEIRDAETADIAVKSALTGHLVLSTVHANDGPGTITRLVDMGVPRYLGRLRRHIGDGAAAGAKGLRPLPRDGDSRARISRRAR